MSFHSAITMGAGFTPPTLSQSRLYAQVLRAVGRKVCRLDLDGYGVARLLLRDLGPLGRVALMPGGPLWRQGLPLTARRDALADLPAVLRRNGIHALITNTASPMEEQLLRARGHLPLITGGYHARLDLTTAPEQRRARLHGKWRNRLCHAESCGLTVHRSTFKLHRHGWLLEVEADQRKTRGYRGLPLDMVSVAATSAPDQVQLFTASQGGARLGAMLFLLHECAATYHIGQVSDQGRALSAHNLLLWQAANWLARKGVSWIDLGPVETEIAPGLARFKLGSGADPVQRGASCLYTSATAPLGRLAAKLRRKAARAPARQSDLSCR